MVHFQGERYSLNKIKTWFSMKLGNVFQRKLGYAS